MKTLLKCTEVDGGRAMSAFEKAMAGAYRQEKLRKAAPELLEALEELVLMVEIAHGHKDLGRPEWNMQMNDAIAASRAAIAKARGKS